MKKKQLPCPSCCLAFMKRVVFKHCSRLLSFQWSFFFLFTYLPDIFWNSPMTVLSLLYGQQKSRKEGNVASKKWDHFLAFCASLIGQFKRRTSLLFFSLSTNPRKSLNQLSIPSDFPATEPQANLFPLNTKSWETCHWVPRASGGHGITAMNSKVLRSCPAGDLYCTSFTISPSLPLISCNFSSVDEQIKAKYAGKHNYYVFCGSITDMGLYLLPPSPRLCFHSCPFVMFGWFISRITQNLLTGLPWNLDGGWVLAQNRQHQLLVPLQIKGGARIFFLTFFYIVRCFFFFFLTFVLISQEAMCGSMVSMSEYKEGLLVEVCTLLTAITVHSLHCPLIWAILNKTIGLHVCYCAPAAWNNTHN